jgi:signal transduction histidine kinase
MKSQGAAEPGAEPLARLLPELSGALLRVAPRELDTEIEGWLERLARLLAIDRVSILQMSPDGNTLHATHSFSTEGVPPFPVVASASEFKWLVQQVRRGRVRHLAHVPRGLPASAEPERAFVASAGSMSYILVPFAIGRSGRGAMALSWIRPHGALPKPVTGRLPLFADVIGNALARKHAWYALEERISFEHLLTDLVATVLGAAPEELDTRIRHGLERVIGYFGVDRCSVVRFADDGASLTVTHSARAPGIPPLRSAIAFPWYVAWIGEGSSTQLIPRQAGFPPEASSEHRYMREAGVRAHLSVPLVAGARPWGAIGFSAFLQPRRWTEEEVQRLGLVGGIVMDALLAREAEQEARQQRDELTHVARVAALGELTTALAHELNQPLMAIRVNAQATRRLLRAGEAADVDEVLGDIAADATRAGDLIRRLRDLLRRRELAKEVLDVNEVVGAVQAIARTEANRHGAELVVEGGVGLPPVRGDAIQLQQVVLNLVRNGAEAMSGQAGSREVRIRTWGTPGEQVTISVEDEGPPVDDATLRAMFTPFSTTKADGLGMGLAISRSIVEAHGGRLWAERRAAGGLAARFSLPSCAADAIAGPLAEAPAVGSVGARQVPA